MKFQKIAYMLPVALMGAFASSCDDIAPEDRYIPFERPEVEKKVLVMEFSGQMCVNCPTGALALHNASDAFPGQVVILTMHPTSSPYSLPATSPMSAGVTNEYSEFYYKAFSPTGFPVASIDGGSLNYNNTEWGSLIVNAIEQETPLTLDLSTEYDAANRMLNITWEANINDTWNGELRVALWITESHIIGFQSTPSGAVREYDHQHILRQTVTEPWGNAIQNEAGVTLAHFVPEQHFTGTVSLQLDEAWNAENCHVAGAVFDPSHKVLQAAETAVIE